MNGVIIALGAFAGIFGIIYVFFVTRHRERIALIEKGADASIFGDRSFTSYPTLKFGMLFVGVGLGILTGNFLENQYDFNKGVAYLSMTFLLGGASLIVNFIIERRMMRNDENNLA
ncbi:DUF6249 domain-containing protein [Dyadobacter psychrophilus]|uniref:DUF6249 domain-containing protein n=1 Tax=Dyadobacter psychrophilus TaxID=651661 RepID=A0A1T5CBJ3_9BACT|nr:DUF6249 domain-containing protein [Dyadobacter psychrophilus]SKB56706.1 hypothetical protein SAMN05660293_01066 [Dyadobacter psychrophilus]